MRGELGYVTVSCPWSPVKDSIWNRTICMVTASSRPFVARKDARIWTSTSADTKARSFKSSKARSPEKPKAGAPADVDGRTLTDAKGGKSVDVKGRTSSTKGKVRKASNEKVRTSTDMSIVNKNRRLNSLIKQNRGDEAEKLFAGMRRWDVVTLNTMMKLHAARNDLDQVVHTFERFASADMEPSVISFSILIGTYASNGHLDRARDIIDTMAVTPNAVTFLEVMKVHARSGNVAEVEDLLDTMKEREIPRISATYNTVLNAYCKAGMVSDTHLVLKAMEEDKVIPTAATFATIMSAFADEKNVAEIQRNYKLMRRMRVRPDAYVYAILIGALVEERKMEEAGTAMANMISDGVKPNEVILLTAIKFYALRGDAMEVLKCLAKLRQDESGLREEQVCAAVNALTTCGCVDAAHALLQKASTKTDVPVTVPAWNALLKAFRNDPRKAESLVSEMLRMGMRPNETTLCTLLDAYIRANELDKASALSVKLRRSKSPLGLISYATLMKLHRERGEVNLVKELFCDIKKAGLKRNEIVYSTLISALGNSGEVSAAVKAYENMKTEQVEPNLVVAGALVDALAKNQEFRRAHRFLDEMRLDGLDPNSFSYTTLAVNLFRAGMYEGAKHIVKEAEIYGVEIPERARELLDDRAHARELKFAYIDPDQL